jgi:hypothetical protein
LKQTERGFGVVTTVGRVEVRLLGAVADDGSAVAVRGATLRSLVAILRCIAANP